MEYVYSKRQFKRSLWICLGVYIALRILRAVLYFTVGVAWLSSIPAATIFFASGVVFGIAIKMIWRYRRSVPVADVDEELDRIKNKT